MERLRNNLKKIIVCLSACLYIGASMSMVANATEVEGGAPVEGSIVAMIEV